MAQPAAEIEGLVLRVVAGETEAWQAFWQAVEPRLYAMLRRPRFLGRLSQSEDDCRNIVVEVLGALQASDHARLRRFLEARERHPNLPFFAWLAVVAKRLAIDYMRRLDAYQDLRAREGGPGGAWRAITGLPGDSELPGARPPFTNRATAAELLAFAGQDLPDEQRQALVRWLGGARFDDIAVELAIPGGARAAERMVRAALERLRRHFRERDDA